MRYIVLVVVLFMLLPVSVTAWSVEKNELEDSQKRRLALVMGNGRYDGLENLPNVRNDTDLISSKLEKLGFETKVVLNSSRKEMLLSIKRFGEQLDDNDVGLFYYAGHAVQQGSLNYMIPSEDAGDIDRSTLEFDAVDLNRVVAQMRDAESSINIIILDACRDNPFKNTSRSRGLGHTKGLAAPSVNVRGMYIAYSTSPGSIAEDGEFENSPYTTALANYIDKPGLGINEIFTKVRSDVIEQTNNAQVPWEMSSLTADFYFSNEQTEEEKSNEAKIEAEMARLKEMLEQERKAKAAAEADRKEALMRLEENKKKLALERSLIEKEKLEELKQVREAQLVNERLEKEAELALAKEQKRKQEEIALAEKERLKHIQAEKKRLAALAKEKEIALKKKKADQKRLAAIARKEERSRRRAEAAELKRIEKLKIEEQEKLARLESAKQRQAAQRAKAIKEARDQELLALRKAELKEKAIAKAEAKEARIAAIKLKRLMAKQQAAIEKAERIEAKRLEEENAREQMLAKRLAEQKRKRLKKEQEALLAQQKREAKESKRLAKIAKEEEERIARERRLIVSMVNNCDRLLSNASSGRKVLSCYREVLTHDKSNIEAVEGMRRLEKAYEARLAESIAQGKLGRVNREFAVLESINPKATQQMFGASVQSLREKARKLSEESSKLVLPTF